MQVSYKRSLNQNYIILQQEGMTEPKGYQTAILLENTVPGLLPCRLQKVNGEALFYYDTTGYQSIQSLYECSKIGEKELAQLLLCAGEVTEGLSEYLLNSDSLLLEAKYIYKNKETQKLSFLYFPYYIRETGMQFQELLEYLLPKINYEDKKAVTMGYGVYKAAANGCITREVIKSFVYSKTEEKKNLYEDYRERLQEEEEEEGRKILDEFYKEDEQENREQEGVAVFVGSILFLAGLIFLARHFRLLSWTGIFLLSTVLGLSLAGAIAWKFLKERKNEKAEEQERAERKEQNEERKKADIWGEEQGKEGRGAFSEWKEMENSNEKSWEAEREESWKPEEEDAGLTTLLETGIEESCACLEWLDQPEQKKFYLHQEVTFIGKWKQTADLWIDDPTVSRTHARIVRKSGKDFLIDLNSRNGTRLNQQYLNPEEEYELKDGDIIQFSRVQFRYKLPDIGK